MGIILVFKILFLGIVEGITEWLPISSTGHMILVDEFIKLELSKAFMEMFLVVIQLGAILAVCVIYFRKLFPVTMTSDKKRKLDYKKILLWKKIIVACIPAAVLGVIFDDILESKFYNYQTVAVTLILYGILFILIENYNKKRIPDIVDVDELTYKKAFIIGLFQVLSLIPGTSRSGSTIIGGILIGTSRTVAAEFTFFLAIPIMFGASLFKLLKFGFSFTGTEILVLAIGLFTAFTVSIFAITFLMNYIKKHDFKIFGWYRIALGILVICYFTIVGSGK